MFIYNQRCEMKTINSVVVLSAAAAMLLTTGCSDDGSSSKKKGSYSEAAVKSVVSYGYDAMGNKVVESNESYTYDADEKLIGSVDITYDYNYVDYDHDNNGTDGNATTPPVVALVYDVETTTCSVTTDEDGRKLTETCNYVNKININGSGEKEWNQLSDYDKVRFSLRHNERDEYTYQYNEDGLIVERTDKFMYWNQEGNETRKYIDGAYVYGDTNASIPDFQMSKVTYTYDTFTTNEGGKDKIRQTVISHYSDQGRLDSDNNIVGTWDGTAELTGTSTVAFRYNEMDKIDAISYSGDYTGTIYEGTDGNLYRAPAPSITSAETLFVYDEDERLEYINYDTGDVTDSEQLLYNEDGRLLSVTDLIPNFNNQKLNELVLNDNMSEIVYDGDEVTQLLFDDESHIDITYEDFNNRIYSVNPMDWFISTEPDEEGRTVYSEGFDD